jgi:hypothetical protein
MNSRRLVGILLLSVAAPATGQGVPRVDTGWGLDLEAASWADHSWHAAVPEIYAAWRQYLLRDPHLQAPTEFWSAAEQEKWPAYDLTASLAYQGMPATVVEITPADNTASAFVVRTLFASVAGAERTVRPLALTRVWAVREGGQWVFANALPRLTASWRREVVGPITYLIHPDVAFSSARAASAVAFADSLAARLNLPTLEAVTYIVAPSPTELHRAMGIDWTLGGRGFGYAAPWNRMILSGSGVFGEENRHELVHYVLGPVLEERQTHGIVNEGLATWLGGTRDMAYRDLLKEYSSYLGENPSVGLNEVLVGDGPDRGWYPAGAVLVQMVYESGGWPAVRQLLISGRSTEALKAALEELLAMPWAEIAASWRAKVLAGA